MINMSGLSGSNKQAAANDYSYLVGEILDQRNCHSARETDQLQGRQHGVQNNDATKACQVQPISRMHKNNKNHATGSSKRSLRTMYLRNSLNTTPTTKVRPLHQQRGGNSRSS